MKKIRHRLLAVSGALAGAMLAAAPVRAQGYTPIYSLDFGNPVVVTEGAATLGSGGRKLGFAVAYLPFVNFYNSGDLGDGTSGTLTTTGRLVALDASFVTQTGKPTFDVGGWYFATGGPLSSNRRDNSLWEFHGRAFASTRREIGIQGGILGSRDDRQPGNRYTLFLVSEYSSQRFRRNSRVPWAVQGGIGGFFNPSFDANSGDEGETRTTVGLTLFVSGSVTLGKQWSATLSEWYIRDRRQDINRLGIGVGYGF